jgi:hypothetical protein
MKNLMVALALGLASAPAFGLSLFTVDSIKIQTILASKDVADRFKTARGLDAISKIPAAYADLVAFRLRSENCWLTVNLRNLTPVTDIQPRYEVADVGEWECGGKRPTDR